MGFRDDVGDIVKECPKNRQTLLFSATITVELADFSEKYMKSPTEIQVKEYVDASKLKQIYYDVRDNEKFSLLVYLLKEEDAHLVMIFCNTRRNVDFVVKNLKEQNITAQAIHGGMSQDKRNSVIKRFDNSKVNVLVCTDVAARGLDIKGVSHVYNYDLPQDAKDYIHRIGRTARAGEQGIAINILASRDYDNFASVQKHNPELKIKNTMTPRFQKVFVKIDREEGRPRRFGNNQSRGPPRGRSDSRGPPRSSSGSSFRRGPPRTDSRGPSRGGSDSRSKPQRDGRNKHSDSRDGFRGGGRNTRPKIKKRY